MSSNFFGILPLEIFHNNSHLKELRLAKTLLDHVPITQLHFVRDNLELLDLTATNISQICPNEFHKMEKLTYLILNDNSFLTEIQEKAFYSLENLKTLELKNNPR